MPQVNIAGRLGKDPSQGNSERAPVSFSVAESVYNRETKEREPMWFDVAVFGKMGERCLKLSKGSYVVIDGELSTREYEGRTYLKVTASNVRFGPKSDDGGQRRAPPPAPDGDGDDIPF